MLLACLVSIQGEVKSCQCDFEKSTQALQVVCLVLVGRTLQSSVRSIRNFHHDTMKQQIQPVAIAIGPKLA